MCNAKMFPCLTGQTGVHEGTDGNSSFFRWTLGAGVFAMTQI